MDIINKYFLYRRPGCLEKITCNGADEILIGILKSEETAQKMLNDFIEYEKKIPAEMRSEYFYRLVGYEL